MSTIKEEILAQTNQGLDVLRHYFGYGIDRKLFKNPYYNDTKGSCSLFLSRYTNTYWIKDNGDPDWCGDCFTLVGKIVGLNAKTDFISIAKIIVNDMGLHLRNNNLLSKDHIKTKIRHVEYDKNHVVRNPKLPTEITPFTIKYKDFSNEELVYFSQSGITKEVLEKYHVKSVKSFSTYSKLGKEYTLYNYPNNPIYDYNRGDNGKLYMPKNNIKYLGYGLRPENFIFGLQQLPDKGDTLIFTAGERDVLTLVSAGYNAITLNSENAAMQKDLLDDLSKRFNKILLMYDTDETGIKSSTKLCKDFFPHLIRIELPLNGSKQEKDITDLFKKFPHDKAKEILQQVIKEGIVKHNTILKSQQPSTVEQVKKTQLKP